TMTSAGCSRRASSMPSRPSGELMRRNPAGARTDRNTVATTGSSSIASTSGFASPAPTRPSRPMLSSRRPRSSGLVRYSAAPSSSPRFSSASTDSMTTGICRVPGSAFSAWSTSKPSSPSRSRSRRIAAGRSGGGYVEEESGPFPRGAADFDGSTVLLGEALGDGEAEAGALVLLRQGAVALDERLEQARHERLIDAGPFVAHPETDRGRYFLGAHLDRRAIAAEFHGVGDQVEEDLPELATVGEDRRRAGEPGANFDALALG